ncbi:MAG: undecaprenyl-diphosphate phosphatase [Clostridia bacterium]|nr:undecaprenyl-diphosphate phosphatase [Clostridia bacterium]
MLSELLRAVLYGIVEGITEWLPVSSTGHLILLEELLPMQVSEAFWEMFLVVVQLGAILAVVVLFWDRIFPFSFSGKGPVIRRDVWGLWFRIFAACLPACVYAFLLDDMVEAYLYNYVTVAVMLILVGVAFLLCERYLAKRPQSVTDTAFISYRTALLIGAFQLIAAILPGTSRSGATIIGGLLLGLSRTCAAEFTFFLAIPVLAGGSLLKLLKFGFSFTAAEAMILAVGTAVSFAVSLLVIRFLLGYVRKKSFVPFAYYRIALGILVIGYFLVTG